ncbi:hypothetical protein BYT27DRAFT_7262198 [Phlegmacium glaucopus]|nr:hypothetical protein BYT27DRAFT_7262198 [Phlegmacium glaucopus]
MAPKKKSAKIAQQNVAKAREELSEQCAEALQQHTLQDMKDQLHNMFQQHESLQAQLAEKTALCEHLAHQLDKSQAKCSDLNACLQNMHSKHQGLYHELRMQRQTTKCGLHKKELLEEQVELLKSADHDNAKKLHHDSENSKKAIQSLLDVNEDLCSQLSDSLTIWTGNIADTKEKLFSTSSKLRKLQKDMTILKKSYDWNNTRYAQVLSATSQKILRDRSVHKLMHKGIFTEETRNVVCILVRAGCSQKYVNKVIVTVLKSAGIETVGSISRPTISWIVREGFYAAQIQLGYEMKNAESMTFSADGTGHRSINYNSRHVNYKAEAYMSGSSKQHQVTRFLGIQSSKDGTSEESVKDWQEILDGIVALYNRSPFGKRAGGLFRIVDILIKLAGFHTDHCAGEKKTVCLIGNLKNDAIDQVLGEEAMLDKTPEEIELLLREAEKKMFQSVGGKVKWDALSDSTKSEKQAIMFEGLIAELGKEAFEMLSPEEKHILKLFIWAGCGCHKDLNTVRGGYSAVIHWWIQHNHLDGPVLLPNRDNAPVIRERDIQVA